MRKVIFWKKKTPVNTEEMPDEVKILPGHTSQYNTDYLDIKKQIENVQQELTAITDQINALENDADYKVYIEAHNHLSKHLEDKGKSKIEEINSRFDPYKGAINAFSLAEESKYAENIEKYLEKYQSISIESSDLREQAKELEEKLISLKSKLDPLAKQLNRNDSATVISSRISYRDPRVPVKTKNPLFLSPVFKSPPMPKFNKGTKEAEDSENSKSLRVAVRARSQSH